MLIRIVPMGNVPSDILSEVGGYIKNIFGVNFRIMGKIEPPAEARSQLRRQYDVNKIIDLVENMPEAKFIEKTTPTLIITDQDIYHDGLNFAFAVECIERGFMIVSLARLKTEFYDEQPDMFKLKERTIKEAIHVIGHYVGKWHCPNTECVMAYSPSVNDIDRKKIGFCEKCNIRRRII